jgi:single-strand DNA-binding protein
VSLPRIQGELARLTKDVEMRYTPSGRAVSTIDLAFNKRTKDRETGEWQDAGTMFVRGAAWEQLGENCMASLSKGDEVIVSGELSVREYERKDGGKGHSVELNIYAIGPNLRTCTAKVSKVTREGSGSSGNGGRTTSKTGRANKDDFDDKPPF